MLSWWAENYEGQYGQRESYAFALKIIRLAQLLKKQKEYELAGQVLRAGTSIGANVEEALAGTSRADFIAKMCIASKEARESHYWLRLLRDSNIMPGSNVDSLIQDADELLRILTAIVKISRDNSKLKTQNFKLSRP